MVGVPGRSKACITCRKRRKGCDLQKPACTQCQKAGLDCAGYDAPRVFVVSTPSRRHAGYSVSAAASHTTQNQLSSSNVTNTNLRLLSRPEDERRCIDVFWEAYYPSGRPIPVSAWRSYMCAWTETARKLYREDDSLRYALWANCLLITGRRHGEEWMLREGSKVYGKALVDLRRSLGVSHRAKGDALIATVKLLSMFEASSRGHEGQRADTSQDWQRHHAGELAMFIARTPVAHTGGDAHHIFADERVDMALSSALRRKQFVLGTPEWKSVPWKETPKNLKDVLVDVLVDIPGLVVDFDNMRLCTEASRQAELRLELVQKCWEDDRQLLSWLNAVCGQNNTNPGVPNPGRQRDIVTHVARVHGMVLYWTMCLVLYSILRAASAPEADLPARTDPLHHARHIAEAIPILLEPSAGLYGQQSAALPLEIAIQYTMDMSPSSSESQEILGKLKTLKEELGKVLTGTVNTALPAEG
ncbi:Sterigmatocystin biosynthesis regulatory protein [Chaetomidium leptoderma]|uniref:Sterigmatocystin biosynthesis regulatory protein n=1 Tax=Chaetomidium leptoderma TaxID=669021 RepID=A0AAN6VPA5_9PEZI|nr:Sterigmatocystin biosynthesis regulatory protein [Chaetomidium leptoderma]